MQGPGALDSSIARRWLIASLLAAGGLAFVCSYHDVGLNYSDEGFAIDAARRIMHGQLIGRDFAQPPQGRFYLFALLFELCGRVDLLALRAVLAGCKALAAVLVFLAGCRFVPIRWAIVPALLTLALSGPFLKAPLVLVYAAAIYLPLWLSERPTPVRSALTGAALGLAAFDRPDVAASVLAFLVPWIYLARKRGTLAHWRLIAIVAAAILAAGAGAAIAVATPFDWRSLPGANDLFTLEGWQNVLEDRLLERPNRPFWHMPILLLHDLYAVLTGAHVTVRDWFLAMAGVGPPIGSLAEHVHLAMVDAMLLAALLGALALARNPEPNNVLLFCVSGAALLKYIARADFPHFTQALPTLALLAAALLFRSCSRPGLLGRALRAGAMAVSAGLLALSTQMESPYAGAIGILRTAQVRLPYPGFEVRTRLEDARELQELLDFARARLTPPESVFVGPFCPLLYALLDLRPPTCYSVLCFPSTPPLQRSQEWLAERVAVEYWVRLVIVDLDPAYTPMERTVPVLWAEIVRSSREVFRNRRFAVRELSTEAVVEAVARLSVPRP